MPNQRDSKLLKFAKKQALPEQRFGDGKIRKPNQILKQ
jgi:hypothetical protein